MQIKDSVIVITGGAQGLGLAMAEDFAKQGAQLALIDINGDVLGDAQEQCEKLGAAKVIGYEVDITDEESVETVFEQIQQEFNGIDVLVNNAGLLRDGLLIKYKDGELKQKMPLQQFQSVLDVNLTGTFLCGREAAAQMVKAGKKGVIINISSVARAGNMGQTNYATSKAGVIGLVDATAKQLEDNAKGMTINAVAPGFIETQMTEAIPFAIREAGRRMNSMSQGGLPVDVAETIAWLASPASGGLNGNTVRVCGQSLLGA